MEYYLITFANTHSALTAQKYLQDKLIFQTIPTLREISASCGISLKIKSADYDQMNEYINEFPLDENMYTIYYITENQISQIIGNS
jgi:hypothetical protein